VVFQKEKKMYSRHINFAARGIAVIMLLTLLTGLAPGGVGPAYAAPGDITRVSVDSGGAQANGGSFRDQISADGRYVAFVSDATNLVPNDTNNAADVFVKDRQTGATTRISVASQTGAQADNGSGTVAISSDGRYVAFYSDANNLVSGDSNGVGDIFVHDRQTGLTTRVSVDSGGVEANGGSSDFYLGISGDGRYVVFPSDATNLVSGDTNNVTDIFVHDCQTGQTRRVSVGSNGAEANGGSSAVNISDDGRYVAFSSGATNLVVGDTNGTRDVFVYDLQMGGTTLVSVNTSGEQADGGGNSPDISGDGR
jgi:tricorn protease-like protein